MRHLQSFLIAAVAILALLTGNPVMAQTNFQIAVQPSPNTYQITWQGTAGRLFLIQCSTDLQTWTYAPEVRLGTGASMAYGFSCTTARSYVRLRYSIATNITSGAGGDFDGDGVSNITEIQMGTDPMSEDSDGDGLDNYSERLAGLNPHATDSDGDGIPDLLEDSDADGAINQSEVLNRSQIWNPDTDADGIMDGPDWFELVDEEFGGVTRFTPYNVVDPLAALPGSAARASFRNTVSGAVPAYNSKWLPPPAIPLEEGEMLLGLRSYKVVDQDDKWAEFADLRRSRYRLRTGAGVPGAAQTVPMLRTITTKGLAAGPVTSVQVIQVNISSGDVTREVTAGDFPSNMAPYEWDLQTYDESTGMEYVQTITERPLPGQLSIYYGQNAAQPVSEALEAAGGAYTVANLNDTDGDGTDDHLDNIVKMTAGAAGVQDEVDLMKLVISGPIKQGRMKVTVVSGAIKFWEKSTKETAVPLTGNAFYVLPAALPRTVWVEATAASTTLRDIEIRLGYETPSPQTLTDNVDAVRATAIWVTRSQFINTGTNFPGEISTEAFINTFTNSFGGQWGIHSVGAPPNFNYAECHEFLISPTTAGSHPDFTWDIGRQRQTRVWRKKADGTANITAVGAFPGGDIANDGPSAADEDDAPGGHHLYSLDSPSIQAPNLALQQAAGYVRIKQMGNFNEFCRVRFNRVPFNELSQLVQGSRCSPKSAWRSRGDVSFTGNNWNFTPSTTQGAENLVELNHDTFIDPQ